MLVFANISILKFLPLTAHRNPYLHPGLHISMCIAGSCISISSPAFLPNLQIYLPLCFLDIGLPYYPLTLSVSKTEINILSLKILLFPVAPLLINGRLLFT